MHHLSIFTFILFAKALIIEGVFLGTLEVDYSIEDSKVLIPFLRVKGD